MKMTIPRLIQKTRAQLHALTGLDLSSTVSVHGSKDGWHIQVEVVEKRSIPDSQDILATYEVVVDDEARVVNLTRLGMRRRNETAIPAGAELEI